MKISLVARNRRAIVSVISLLAIAKPSKAVAVHPEPLETRESFNPNETVTNESRRACVRHPKLAQHFCTSA
ncbi:MAG: hypothetical protein ACFB4I_21630 [Cyanophyceae cyanobacterium]